MNKETDRFRHDRSAYERPTLGWRCGRSAGWNLPCKHGPTAGGSCGGENACAPGKSGDAWKCRRSAAEGGACANGPGADGSCGLRRPPCVPRRSLAVWRGRFSILAFAASVALIAVLALRSDMLSGRLSSLDPGPLSSVHANFIGESDCATCHTAVGSGAAGWWRAFWSSTTLMPAVQPASAEAPAAQAVGSLPSHRLSAACTGCHGFGGREQQAHNRTFESRPELASTDCLMCHTEHKGVDGRNTRLTQAQCQSCHTRTIKNFASGHAPFTPNFPYDHPQSIRFDHVSHFGKHFAEPSTADKVPPGRCVGCHVVGQGGRALRPANFETVCAGCHEEGIAKRDLVFFRWPELATNTIAAGDVAKACGPSADAKAGAPAPAFSAVSSDPPTALGAYILGVPSDSVADYEKPIQDLARAMITDGADPLLAAARDRVSAAQTERLFSGLDTEMTRQATCAWAANQEYAPPTKATLPGWRAEALDLRYTHPSHADPVVKAWIDFVAGVPTPETSDAQVRLQRARKEILSAEGPGQCAKCHTVSGQPDGTLAVSWKVQFRNAAPLTRFDHRPHLSLLGPEKTCTSCHQLADETSEVGAKLKPITLATCTECHAAGKVRDDCRTCHVYHQDHAFKKRMVQDAN